MGAGYSIKAKANASAEIMLYEDIGASFFGGVTAKDFAKDLKGLGKVDQIDLRINSYGGDVFDGLAIYRQLIDHPAKVVSHIDGIAASIASVIAMAGDEVQISESGFLMIHNASGVALGTAKDMREMADTLETVTGSLADVYVARGKQKMEQVRAWMDAETWFSGAEAVSLGFADTVMANMKVAAKYDPARHKFQHPPAALTGRPTFDAVATKLSAMKLTLERHRIGVQRAA